MSNMASEIRDHELFAQIAGLPEARAVYADHPAAAKALAEGSDHMVPVRLARDPQDALTEANKSLRVGTRVVFVGSRAGYSNAPEVGEQGTVTTMPGFGNRTYLPGPGGGLLYVDWDELGVSGIAPQDLEKVNKPKAKKAKQAGQQENVQAPLSEADLRLADILPDTEKMIKLLASSPEERAVTASNPKFRKAMQQLTGKRLPKYDDILKALQDKGLDRKTAGQYALFATETFGPLTRAEFHTDRGEAAPAEEAVTVASTVLDRLLDKVKPGQSELTLDTSGYSRAEVDKIIAAAKARGLHAAASPNSVLVRDLSKMHEAETAALSEAKSFTTKADITSKKGVIIAKGTKVTLSWKDKDGKERASFTRLTDDSGNSVLVSTENLPTKVSGVTNAPSIATMEKWSNNGIAKSILGAKTEPDGWDSDGSPSWMLAMGMI